MGPATGGMPLPEEDQTEWIHWWEINKAPYLNLKKRIHSVDAATGGGGLLSGIQGSRTRQTATLRPSLEQLRGTVTPALKRALDGAGSRDITSSCLIALAKIGQAEDLDRILKIYMTSRDQEISETAVLAHGIAQLAGAVPDLLEIFRDTPRGRELVGDSPRVNFRKQAFAGYALGLIAHAAQDSQVKRTVYEAAKELLVGAGRFAGRDIPVSAILAIRLLAPDLARPEEARLALEAGRFLLDFMKDRENRFQVRAHVPAALAVLLGKASPAAGDRSDDLGKDLGPQVAALRAEAIQLFLQALQDKGENNYIIQSCVLALGQMGSGADKDVLRILEQTASGNISRDIQVRNFAIVSLGTLGGDEARSALLTRLAKPGAGREKPWIALALGLLVADRLEAGAASDPVVGDTLAEAFDKMKNPAWKAGIAVSLGLARHLEAGPKIREEMNRSKDIDLRGYCAVALGMMQFREATEDLNILLSRSLRIPDQLQKVAIGLGLMGDKSLVKSLLQALTEGSRTVSAQASAASGLGFVGDQRAVLPLVDMLFDKGIADLSRAFAAVALGLVGDKEDLPWNSKIGFGINYRANVETLVGNTTGILDIL